MIFFMDQVDVYEILRYAPKGLKLWDEFYGDVYLNIDTNSNNSVSTYPITVRHNGTSERETYNRFGKRYSASNEPSLWPSETRQRWDSTSISYLFKQCIGSLVRNKRTGSIYRIIKRKNGQVYLKNFYLYTDVKKIEDFGYELINFVFNENLPDEEEDINPNEDKSEEAVEENTFTVTLKQYRPGAKVLVRNKAQDWKGYWTLVDFSHIDPISGGFVAGGSIWDYCIPYKKCLKQYIGTSFNINYTIKTD